jgi:hypothetical protein
MLPDMGGSWAATVNWKKTPLLVIGVGEFANW